jgi:hypothetical protein
LRKKQNLQSSAHQQGDCHGQRSGAHQQGKAQTEKGRPEEGGEEIAARDWGVGLRL